ncbi:lytic polysaccharide monooxygenase [Aaosphaeria arxii CBS 175.79]|uniref:lytic cellulose monooxygenase (C4-dehydrogenating) n=1 Tax=Aaosphaeria arxii CBS 175.79 TaxID=1450172 RepID=A0A6A5XY85_9PLEO|nr:lytic polysaccharide monooxygenase [Aaosphaeria arxii CBS 175.79]KAF2018285.1 lytic polysaccharide monooxygenase [Aaosphaeria arxii CBS 175.79]
MLTKFTAFLCLIAHAKAHFTTGHLFVNGTDTGLWKHVLEVAIEGNPLTNGGFPPTNHFLKTTPQFAKALDTKNITCGRAAFNSMEKTEIADVEAGEEIGFGVMTFEEVGHSLRGIDGRFYHPGPAQIWLSRAPGDDLKAYRGDGDWFKVAWAGPLNNTKWTLQGGFSYNFTLPLTTPPGKYLMRFEYLMPSVGLNQTQWYINCALINLKGPGGGTPTGFARFPGAYKPDDPGLWIPWNQEEGALPDELMRLMDYTPPGPPVWRG